MTNKQLQQLGFEPAPGMYLWRPRANAIQEAPGKWTRPVSMQTGPGALAIVRGGQGIHLHIWENYAGTEKSKAVRLNGMALEDIVRIVHEHQARMLKPVLIRVADLLSDPNARPGTVKTERFPEQNLVLGFEK